jgi:hypothetical protein
VVPPNVDALIGEFREDFRHLPVFTLVQKYITYGNCYAIDQAKYFELKLIVAQEFNLHHSEVLIVGSAKMGFSIVSTKRYRPFGDSSDIDVALISQSLFEEIWYEAFEYWRSGSFWPEIHQFQEYLFRGWIRPDKLPPEKTFQRSRQWWEFFRQLTNSQRFGPYKIGAGLYKSWHFLEAYQTKCVTECRQAEIDT